MKDGSVGIRKDLTDSHEQQRRKARYLNSKHRSTLDSGETFPTAARDHSHTGGLRFLVWQDTPLWSLYFLHMYCTEKMEGIAGLKA